MLLNYLKISSRNFIKHRLYSLINVVGLACGLTCCLLIALYVLDESTFDRQHPDADRIYRISETALVLDDPLYLGTTAPQVGPLLKDAFDEVEDFTRMFKTRRVFSSPEGIFHEEEVILADPSLFAFLELGWVQGDPETALAEPGNVVLTRSFARKYLGEEEPFGKTLTMGNKDKTVLRVTGIVEDLPHNMSVATGAFLPLTSLPANVIGILQNWEFPNLVTWIKLVPQADLRKLEDAFWSYLYDSMPEDIRDDWAFSALALPDLHLYSPQTIGDTSTGNLANIRILTAIGAGLLLLAGINFVNLATARALQRSKEIVIRKAIGSSRKQLFQQFMGESLLLVVIAFMIALMLVELLLPVLNVFAGKQMKMATLFASVSSTLAVAATVVGVALLAGAYPALYLSALRPAHPAAAKSSSKLAFRDMLVILQFAISIMLVIATLVVHAQVQFGKNIETGFNRQQLLAIETPDSGVFGNTWWPALKSELMSNPDIVAATQSLNRPYSSLFISEFDVRYQDGAQPTTLTQLPVEYDFFETYQVPLLAGRPFSEEFGGERLLQPTDDNPFTTAAFVLNRAAVEKLGWTPDEAVGKWVERDYSEDFSRIVRGQVVGVVENIRFDSLRQPIKPTFYSLPAPDSPLNDITLRVSGHNMEQVLAHIDSTWARLFPGQPLHRAFIDADFQALYIEEEKFIQLLSAFAFISIVISCLGLFGLTAFTVERRTREIGVRKVMGSSVWSIVLLLTRDFSKLVLISNLIAWPLAYVAMQRWLENFAYRVDLTPLVFIGSGFIALCIAWVTVGTTAAQAASRKPVLALRYE